ncbi:unnamed protein product [Staurois parvus]|uniref:NADH dehydrogenase subunit 6 n=1 Tax=Staurois parvus TaxID=386267 RepID=A0ABN9GF66_9NEOB|nr:unnamed protein product [Staurois parvus]
MYGLCTVLLILSCMLGVILSICYYSVCMDSAQYHLSCSICRVEFSVSVLIMYVWTLHSTTYLVLYAGCNSRICYYSVCMDSAQYHLSCCICWVDSQYLFLLCMYGLCTVLLLLSCVPGIILGICSYSVCMDSAQSHFPCPVCWV